MFPILKALGANHGQTERPDQSTLSDALKADFKSSVRIEKYRVGKLALYIPAGFSWKYLLKEEITGVTESRWFIQSDNGVAPFAMEAPALRIRYGEDEEILHLEKDKNAQKALDLLKSEK